MPTRRAIWEMPRVRRAQRRLRQLASARLWRMSREDIIGYGYALLGVVAVTLAIALIERFAHISNISLLYLLVVLWLAAWVGRGPAVLASVLAFFAYDLFFIPPFYHVIVDDPTEWLSLLALLVTSLVTGQLASAVRDRARDAQQSQQQTATLYGLAQLIASAKNQTSLLDDLAQRMLSVFAPSGVTGVAVLLPGEGIYPVVRALATDAGRAAEQQALRIATQTYAAEAAWALEHRAAIGDTLMGAPDAREAPGSQGLVYFIPLVSGQRAVGLLALTGSLAIRALVVPTSASARANDAGVSSQAALFAACCDQMVLGMDRAALQQQAIHAEALHESSQLKDVFLGSVTHDLRTPLASIKAAVTSLLSPTAHWKERERREFLESIEVSADRLNRLVGNLVDISRQEAGVATPEKDWYLIGDVIATVLDRLEMAGELQGREIEVEVADDIPLVAMDHTQIEQVLTNLLENALKYSPAERPVRVTAAAIEGPPRELEARVIDQGIGVPSSEREAIFDKFYRVQHVHLPWASERPPTGTGLGLAISENIICAHGGRIWAESTPGEGSTFIFRLPIPAETPQGALPEIAPEGVQQHTETEEIRHAER